MLHCLPTIFTWRTWVGLLLGLLPLAGRAQTGFTYGNSVVVRVGDGSAALSAAAAATFLEEYTPANVFVQRVALPTAVSGSNRRLTNSGSATSEGLLSLSTDHRFLTLAGYDANVNTASVGSTSATATNRVVGLVDAGAGINTTTALTDASSTNNFRSAVTADGSSFWVGGAGTASTVGTRYVSSVGATTSTQLNATNTRAVGSAGGQLYFSTGSGTAGVYALGTGLPTTSAAASTTPVLASADPYGFQFVDLNNDGTLDVAYVANGSASSTNRVQKFVNTSGTWAPAGAATLAGAFGVAVRVTSATSVTVSATSASGLVSLTDNSGTGPLTASFGTATTPATNTAFRGLAFAPTPTIGAPTGGPSGTISAATAQPYTLAFSYAGKFATGTTYTAELSDASGSFPGTSLGSTTATNATSLDITIAAGTANGTYAIRITAATAGLPGVSGAAAPAFTIGTPAGTPTLTVSTGTATGLLSGFSTVVGTPSPAQQYTLTGTSLTADVLVTPPAGYQASQTSATAGFGNDGAALTVTAADAAAGKSIYVRLSGTLAGSYAGSVTNTSTGASPQTVAVSGRVLAPEPTTQPTVTLVGSTGTTATLALSGGNGAKRLLVLRPATAAAAAPADGTTYSASPTYGTPAGASSTTGPGSYVLVADGSTSSLTTTGLSGSTTYTAEVYAYSDNGTAGAENYLTPTPGTVSFTTPVATYTWTGATSASWSEPTNWLPARPAPGATDVLTFDGSATALAAVTLDYASTQTLGQLRLLNGVTATFTTPAARTLALAGNLAGDDLVLDATSALTLLTATDGTGLTLSLASAETAALSGALTFDGTATATGRHTLISAAANSNALEFRAGSHFRTTAYFNTGGSNSPFGTSSGTLGAAFSVIFRNGSHYQQSGGNGPFQLSAPSSYVTFEPGSSYLFDAAAGAPALSGRTYGTLTYSTSAIQASTGGSPLTVQGDLVVASGTVGLNLTGGIVVQGNVVVSGTAALSFAPATAGTTLTLQGNVTVNSTATFSYAPTTAGASPAALPGTLALAGTTPQALGGSSTAPTPISLGSLTTLALNNAAGATLGLPLTVPGTLQLTSGLLTTTAASLLTLAASATVGGGSAASFVNGPVARPVGPVSSASSVFFPVGKGTAYRPLKLNVAAQTSTTTYCAEQHEGNPGQAGTNPAATDGSTLTRVSQVRSFTITPLSGGSVTQPTGFSGTVTLRFDADDQVSDSTAASLVVAKRANSSQPWASCGRATAGGTGSPATAPYLAGTLTSGSFTSFSDFVLASTDPASSANPLPVQLVSFGAVRTTSGGVALAWTTASELNSAAFVLERSPDGQAYERIATVAAQGTTATAHSYTAQDAAAPAVRVYYRLRQLDQDGTSSYSSAVSVAAEVSAPTSAYPNPATDYLTVPGAAGRPASLLDAAGRCVRAATLDAAGQLSLSGLPSGLYLLRVPGWPAQRISKQ